jgi:hypothetical protein
MLALQPLTVFIIWDRNRKYPFSDLHFESMSTLGLPPNPSKVLGQLFYSVIPVTALLRGLIC